MPKTYEQWWAVCPCRYNALSASYGRKKWFCRAGMSTDGQVYAKCTRIEFRCPIWTALQKLEKQHGKD